MYAGWPRPTAVGISYIGNVGDAVQRISVWTFGRTDGWGFAQSVSFLYLSVKHC